MPANVGVSYIDFGLNSVDDYWGEVVMPGVKDFRASPSPRTVFNAALGVWQLHDWVWHERNPGQNSRGAAFNRYREDLLTACPQLGWLRDVADAGKHRGLGRLPEVKNAEPHTIAVAGGLLLLIGAGGGGHRLAYFLVLHAATVVLPTCRAVSTRIDAPR